MTIINEALAGATVHHVYSSLGNYRHGTTRVILKNGGLINLRFSGRDIRTGTIINGRRKEDGGGRLPFDKFVDTEPWGKLNSNNADLMGGRHIDV